MVSNYYCYRVTDKITVTGVTNLGTYNMTLKPKIGTTPILSNAAISGKYANIMIQNNNAFAVKANIS
jgi:hypothetical protein